MVGGFLVASVYATGMLRGRIDRYHRLGFLIAFSVAAVATPVQMGVGDALARWVYNNQPVKFAAIELVPKTEQRRAGDAAGPPQRRRHGERRDRDPRPGLLAVRPQYGQVDDRAGSGHGSGRRATDGPSRPTRSISRGTSWSASGPCCSCSPSGTPSAGSFRRRMPASRWFLWAAASSGVLSVIAMEAGWVVTEVGRQPWIVYKYMKVEDAATGNTGRLDHVHRGRGRSTLAVGLTMILVLRSMSRRFRRAGGLVDHDGPYGPRVRRRARKRSTRERRRTDEHRRRRRTAPRRGRVCRVRWCRLRRGILGPDRRGTPSAASDRAPSSSSRSGPVWEANHVWLIFIFVVLWTSFPEAYASIMLTLFVPLTLAALGIVLRGASFAFRQAVVTTACPPRSSAPPMPRPRCWCRTAWAPSPVASPRAGFPQAARPGTRSTAGSTRHRSSAGVLGVAVAAYLSAVYLVWDARRLGEAEMVTYFRLRAIVARRRSRHSSRSAASFVLRS